jgi:hypothetical protein
MRNPIYQSRVSKNRNPHKSKGMRMKKKKLYKFSDDGMFSEVMQDKNLCRRLLIELLQVPINEVISITPQNTMSGGKMDGRGIRLDILAVDDSGTRYDIEMQTGNFKNLEDRCRGYQSRIDFHTWYKNNKYSDLKNTYIIFLCTNDPFKEGKPIYDLSPQRSVKTHWLAFNAAAYNSSPVAKNLLKYISTGEVTNDPLVIDIETEVETVNNDAERWNKMATVETLINDYKRELEKQKIENSALMSKVSKLEKELSELKSKKD